MSNLVYQNYSNKCKGWTNPSSISLGPQITSLSEYHSPAGSTTIVTINGYNFYSYSQIVFGTFNPTTYFINSTILQFYIPSNLTYGIYPIQVFNGAIASNIVTYTIDQPTSGITKSQADALYLSKVNDDTSNALLTTFNGALTVGSTATFNGDLNVYSNATFYSDAPVCGITATSGNDLVNKYYVDNAFNTLSPTLSTFNNILNFSSNAFTNLKKSIVYNFNTTTTITKSNVKAKLSNYANNSQVYTFGQKIPNRWVAVGAGTYSIASSSDGLSWTGINGSTNIFTEGYGVAWNGEKWVAVGKNSVVACSAYSYDGLTWTFVSLSSYFGTLGAFCVASNGTMWVVGGNNYYIVYSTDGINWNPASIYPLVNGYGVAWNGTMWIVAGESYNNNIKLMYSYNGINWAEVNSSPSFANYAYGIAWNGTMWVATGGVDGSVRIGYSYNGFNWASSTSGSNLLNSYGRNVAWNGTMWIAGGAATNTIIYSYDGINWTGVTGSTNIFSSYGKNFAWNGTMWVAVGEGTNTLTYSYNGNLWAGVTGSINIFSTGFGIAFNSKRPNTITFPTNLMVLGGNGGKPIGYSYDGTVWTGITGSNGIFDGFMLGVAWNGTMWVGVGGQGQSNTYTIAYSYNGVTGWTGVIGSTGIFYDRGLRVAWNGNLWVAVGGANTIGSPYTIAYSYNGINDWTGVNGSTGIFSYFGKGIAWNGQMWIAVGRGSYSIAYSYYGATGWIGVTGSNSILSAGYDVSWNGTMWVAVGTGSYPIAYSYYGATGWTNATDLTGIFSSSGQCVAWNGSMWVAGGEGASKKTIAYSYYGATGWTPVSNLNDIWNSGTAGSVVWNGQKWIMTGYTVPNNYIMAYSSDGQNWSGQSVAGISYGYAIGWNAGLGSVNIPNDSIVLNQYGSGLSSQLDVVTDSYYNTGFTNCSISINSIQ